MDADRAPGEASRQQTADGPNFGCALVFFILVAALGAVAIPRLYSEGFFGRAPEVALAVAPFEATGGVSGEVTLRSQVAGDVASAEGVEIVPWDGGEPVGAELLLRGVLGPAPAGGSESHRLDLRVERWPAGTLVWEGSVTGSVDGTMGSRAAELVVRVLRTAR